MKETESEEAVRVPCEPQLFPSLLQNIPPSELSYREKRVCFHAEPGFQEPNIVFVLSFFHPFISLFFIFLIGLTGHSPFTSMLGSVWDPRKSILKEANLRGSINQLLVSVEGGLKTIKSTKFSGLLLSLWQMSTDTNAETIKLAWWKTSKTFPLTYRMPESSVDLHFWFNQDIYREQRSIPALHHLAWNLLSFRPLVLNYSHPFVCLHSYPTHEHVFVSLYSSYWNYMQASLTLIQPPSFNPHPCLLLLRRGWKWYVFLETDSSSGYQNCFCLFWFPFTQTHPSSTCPLFSLFICCLPS